LRLLSAILFVLILLHQYRPSLTGQLVISFILNESALWAIGMIDFPMCYRQLFISMKIGIDVWTKRSSRTV
jgi:hypothetical protein